MGGNRCEVRLQVDAQLLRHLVDEHVPVVAVHVGGRFQVVRHPEQLGERQAAAPSTPTPFYPSSSWANRRCTRRPAARSTCCPPSGQGHPARNEHLDAAQGPDSDAGSGLKGNDAYDHGPVRRSAVVPDQGELVLAVMPDRELMRTMVHEQRALRGDLVSTVRFLARSVAPGRR